MVLNTDNTKTMIITMYQRYNYLHIKEGSILLGNEFIQHVKVEEMLGVKESIHY